jgi:hypothetical protein
LLVMCTLLDLHIRAQDLGFRIYTQIQASQA